MKKRIVMFFVILLVSLTLTAGIDAAIHSPKNQCYDAEGKWDPQVKTCDPNQCTCLFHRIGDFVKDFVKGL